MTPKIENRSYSYAGLNVCAVSATLNIYVGETVIASTGLSASYNIAETDFAQEITRQLTEQVMSYMVKLAELDALRLARFPESTDFGSALNQIFDPLQAAIGGA